MTRIEVAKAEHLNIFKGMDVRIQLVGYIWKVV